MTDSPTPLLSEARALCEKATPGPDRVSALSEEISSEFARLLQAAESQVPPNPCGHPRWPDQVHTIDLQRVIDRNLQPFRTLVPELVELCERQERRITFLKGVRDQAEEAAVGLRDLLNETCLDVGALRAENDALKSNLDSELASFHAHLSAENEKLKQELLEDRASIRRLVERLAAQEAENEKLQAVVDAARPLADREQKSGKAHAAHVGSTGTSVSVVAMLWDDLQLALAALDSPQDSHAEEEGQ